MQNIDLSKMDTDEIFQELKKSVRLIDSKDLDHYERNLIVALNSALKTEQKILIEQCIFFHKCLEKENELIALGFDRFIYKDDLTYIIDKLNEKNTKNIYFIELENYPRVIPNDVVEKIKTVKDRKIFDNYYVLYTDYTRKTQNTGERVRKDPIVFGAFSASNAEGTIRYMSERMYYIADWVDEYCDLTLDRLLNVVPEKVHSLYANNDIDMRVINKIKNDPAVKNLYDGIMSEINKKQKSSPKKTLLSWLKGLFK